MTYETKPGYAEFFVEMTPAPGGSKKAITRGGKTFLIDACKNNKKWRQKVAATAIAAVGKPMFKGPLVFEMAFIMPRPKAHYRTNGEYKAWAPWCPTVRPDLTKLIRSTEDALTKIMWNDDAQVVAQVCTKRHVMQNEEVGAFIIVRKIPDHISDFGFLVKDEDETWT